MRCSARNLTLARAIRGCGPGCPGVAWLSSVRVVRCSVQSKNERNLRPVYPGGWRSNGAVVTGLSGAAGGQRRRRQTRSSPHDPHAKGCKCGTVAVDNAWRWGNPAPTAEPRPRLGLRAATRPHERGLYSNRASERSGEADPKVCTYRPSLSGRVPCAKSSGNRGRKPTARHGAPAASSRCATGLKL